MSRGSEKYNIRARASSYDLVNIVMPPNTCLVLLTFQAHLKKRASTTVRRGQRQPTESQSAKPGKRKGQTQKSPPHQQKKPKQQKTVPEEVGLERQTVASPNPFIRAYSS